MTQRRSLLLAAAGSLAAPGLRAQGAEWPSRTVRVIVGFPPGGSVDVLTRILAERMQARTGQAWVVENRPGAGGNLASEATVNAPADGTALMMGTIASLVMNPIMTRLSFDVLTDLTAIGRSVEVTNFLVVAPEKPWRSLAELIAAAKAKPGELSYGSSGVGGAGHLGGALLDSMAGIETIHVPYRGGGQLISGFLAGDVDVMSGDLATLLPHVREGRGVLLGVSAPERLAILPEVPSFAETVPGTGITIWFALFAPRGFPEEAIGRINAELAPLREGSPLAARMAETGGRLVLAGPGELTERLRRELPLWRQVVAEAGIKPE